MVEQKSVLQRFIGQFTRTKQLAASPPMAPLAKSERSMKVITINASPIGSSGIESYAGYPSEDYLQIMRGSDRADIFDKMRRGDSCVKMILLAVKSSILAATFEIKPASDKLMSDRETAEADAELARHILFNTFGDQEDGDSFLQFVKEALTMIEFGHSVFEMVDKPIINDPTIGTHIGIGSMGWRSPRTIERWNLNKQTQRLESISQYAFGDLDRTVDIPSEFLAVFSLDREGSNYEGISALRPCYGDWFRKQHFHKMNAIGAEKFAIPTPTVAVPDGKENSQEFEEMKAVLERFTSHESAYLSYPAGWELELHSNLYDPAKLETSIDKCDTRMVKAFMANFLELGLNGFGSQSLSFDLSDFFLNSLQHIADSIAKVISVRIIKRYVMINRGPRAAYPTLEVNGISDKAGQELAGIIKIFTDSGIIKADDPLEEHVRLRYGLPEADPLSARERPQPSLFGPGGAPGGDPGQDPVDRKKEEEEPKKEKSLMERIRTMRGGAFHG